MRLALAQINPTIGAIDANLELMLEATRQAHAAGAALVVFPELSICGYPPRDLILHEGFLDHCARAADTLASRAADLGPTAPAIILGLPMRAASPPAHGPAITNSLLVYARGSRIARYDKRLLPTYDVFDEDRYFAPGTRSVVVELPLGPGPKLRVGLSICEDLWKGQDAGFASHYDSAGDPVAELVAAGAQVIVSPSASPFVLGKGARHREILRTHATRHRLPVVSVNQVGGNDELIFDGHSAVIGPDGSLLAAAPGFESAVTIVDLAAPVPCADPLASLSTDEAAYRAMVLGVRDYARKTGFRSAILGLSGGIDSAVTAAIAVAALGPANVTGVAMPGPYSSHHSKFDAYDLARRLNIACLTVPIDEPLAAFRAPLDAALASLRQPALGAALPDLAEENLQSRLRGTLLMALSNRTGALVLTTGNKSELAVGYCTLYGDMNGGLAVLSDVTKELVYRLARWMNAHHEASAFAEPPIPLSTIDKAPSAELRPNQTDQDSLPPYDVLDEILRRSVELRQSPKRIIDETRFDEATVRRIVRLIDLAEYKRKQAATGLKLTSVAFGSGRRVPIAQRWTAP
jgi:NAD+ synthetase